MICPLSMVCVGESVSHDHILQGGNFLYKKNATKDKKYNDANMNHKQLREGAKWDCNH